MIDRFAIASVVLATFLAASAPAQAADEGTSFVSVGPLGGARLVDGQGWSGVVGAEVSWLPFTKPICAPTRGAAVGEARAASDGCDSERIWLPGLVMGAAYAPEHRATFVSIEGQMYALGSAKPGAWTYGAAAGPTLALADEVDFGAQITLWGAFSALVPYVRGGLLFDAGLFGEVGVMLKAPIPLL